MSENECDAVANGGVIGQFQSQVNYEGVTGRVAFDARGFRRSCKLDILEMKHEDGLEKVSGRR